MTFDNGREFCGHGNLSDSLKLETFFANSYHSWERGLNKHMNGFIREFYPKSTNFKIVKEDKKLNLIKLSFLSSFRKWYISTTIDRENLLTIVLITKYSLIH